MFGDIGGVEIGVGRSSVGTRGGGSQGWERCRTRAGGFQQGEVLTRHGGNGHILEDRSVGNFLVVVIVAFRFQFVDGLATRLPG